MMHSKISELCTSHYLLASLHFLMRSAPDCCTLRMFCLLLHRAAHNWKLLKELEKAAKVYWDAKDRLPPRVRAGYFIIKFISSNLFSDI